MTEADHQRPEQAETCGCFSAPSQFLTVTKELGMDVDYAEISLLSCSICGQQWLRYYYEIEAFTASGRWYLGAIDAEQAARLTSENARDIVEGLGWYFFGGSYFGGKSGKRSGKLNLI